jgi:hypothetical protein
MKSLTLTVASLAVLALAACQQPAETEQKSAGNAAVPGPAADAPTLPPANLEDPQQLALAFRAAWDRAPPAKAPAPEQSGGGDFTFSAGKLIALGGDRYAFVSNGQGGDGHVSPGAVAIHYLQRTPDGFRRGDATPLIVDGGTFGNPPEWTIQPGLLPAPALIATSGGVWQGYACSGASVVELTPERPVLRADYVRLNYSNGGAVMEGQNAEEMEGRLVPATPGRDFAVQYSGASTARVTWRLAADGTYKPANEPADLPWC